MTTAHLYVPEQPCANGCHTGPPTDRTPVLCEHGARICPRCIDRLDTWLRQIPDTYALLPAVIEHGTVSTNPETASTKRPDPPAPLRLEVLDLLDVRPQRGAAGLLDSWADVIRDQRQLPLAAAASYGVAPSCRLLLAHLPWASQQEWITDLYAEIKPLVRELLDRVGEYRPKPVGWCKALVAKPGEPALVVCGGGLFLDKDRRGCHCANCGARFDGADPGLRVLGRVVGLLTDDSAESTVEAS